MKNNYKETKTPIALYAIIIIVVIIAGILGFLYMQTSNTNIQQRKAYDNLSSNYGSLKSTSQEQTQNYDTLNQNYDTLNQSYNNAQKEYTTLNGKYSNLMYNASNPYIKVLYSNQTVTIPKYTESYQFYNSTYNLYNNYTIEGAYNITFTAPYDGYLLLYVNNTSSPIGTYGIEANSNVSSFEYYYNDCPNGYCVIQATVSGETQNLKGSAGFLETPDKNQSFWEVIPILRGNIHISLDNLNNFPITMKFSLTYYGDRESNNIQVVTR